MKRARLALIAIVATLFATGASAQETAQTYFRQYRDAIAAGDLTTAEAAASNALAASLQSDGQAGNTPALALNLARVRIQLGQWQQARAPAQQAYDLSRAGASSIDPAMSELLWGRVRLATDGFGGVDFLARALDRAADRADLLGDRYDAADQLGLWAVESGNYIIARRAWALAADAAEGAAFDARYARGRARAYEGIAIAMQSVTRDPLMSPTIARQVRERLAEAHALVRPFVFNAAPNGQLVATQELYAQILAWDAAIWSKMVSDTETRQYDGDGLRSNITSVGDTPVCEVRRTAGNAPTYAVSQSRRGGLGTVVVRLQFGDDGSFRGADIAASVGDERFEREVAEAAATWVYAVDIENGCRVLPVRYVPVAFYLRS